MPTGDVHEKLCKDWGVYCRFANWSTCPLDKDQKWKQLHHGPHKWLNDQAKIQKPPGIEDCEIWVRDILETLEPNFTDFHSELPGVSEREARLCWTAHLVADWASDYWHVGTGQPNKLKYSQIIKSQPAYQEFLRELAVRFL
jgi:hypothetical protein